MRLYVLPISTRRFLLYCEPLRHSAPPEAQTYVDRVVSKASSMWVSWEKDTQSYKNWKQRTTGYGNMLFRRIPYQEWGLKTIPPVKMKGFGSFLGGIEKPGNGAKKVEVRFPGQYLALSGESVTELLRKLVGERKELHRKRMWGSILGMPLTLPFGLIPVLPNLPFFYLVFRAWSHYRASAGISHLTTLLDSQPPLLSPTPSNTLDSLYSLGLRHKTRAEARADATVIPPDQSANAVSQIRGIMKERGQDVLILPGWNGKLIAEKLGLPGLEIEIERAVEQCDGKMREDRQQEAIEKYIAEREDAERRIKGLPRKDGTIDNHTASGRAGSARGTKLGGGGAVSASTSDAEIHRQAAEDAANTVDATQVSGVVSKGPLYKGTGQAK